MVAATLGLIILLSFLVVAFMEDARDRIRYHAQFQYRDDLRIEAYSALETTLAVLNIFHEVDQVLWDPVQGWGRPLEFAGYQSPRGAEISVEFTDESGRFPLNTADPEIIRMVLYELGFSPMQQDQITDGLLDWIDEDDLQKLNGFDGDDYRRLQPVGYEPANRPIRSWDELALIQPFKEHFFDEAGFPLPVLDQFRSAFSLINADRININAASPLVIRVLDRLGVIDPYNLEQYRAGLDGEPGTADDRAIRSTNVGGIFADPENTLVTTEIELMEVAVTVRRGDASFLLRTLVSWRGANASANDSEETGVRTTESARGDDERDTNRRSRGSARTAAGTAAQLGYPFQIHWIAENRQN